MRHRRVFIPVIGITRAGTLYAYAQWLNYPDSHIPRTKDGKPNLTAPVPRLNDKPNISGVWQAERSPASEYDSVLGKGFTALQRRRCTSRPAIRCHVPIKVSGRW